MAFLGLRRARWTSENGLSDNKLQDLSETFFTVYIISYTYRFIANTRKSKFISKKSVKLFFIFFAKKWGASSYQQETFYRFRFHRWHCYDNR